MADYSRITTIWAHPAAVHLVLAQLVAHMERVVSVSPTGSKEYAKPYITGFQVLDDRGGSGHYQVRVEDLSVKQVRAIIGQGLDITRESV